MTDTPFRGALEAAKRGWYVFPIAAGAKKPPLLKEWERRATTDPTEITMGAKAYLGCNWGIACGPSGLLVVDIDVKDNGYDTLKKLVEEKFCPATLEVDTPSGGLHLYYRGRTASGVRNLGMGVDTRSSGGYVMCPGSSVAGRYYTIRGNGECVNPSPAPEELVERIGLPREKKPARQSHRRSRA